MDLNKAETKLQKDINNQKKKNLEALNDDIKQSDGADTSQTEATTKKDDEEEESEKSSDEERPQGIVQPKYKVVHSYPHDMMDAWEGSRDTLESSKIHNKSKLPDSITVTIFAKHCESMKVAKLDINESTLVFEVPDLYYLDLNLKYQVNSEAGSAKFDKTKKTLTIRVPVTGLTEDSQKVLEEHYREYREREQERIKSMEKLQESKLEE